jgi:hypothetical protein
MAQKRVKSRTKRNNRKNKRTIKRRKTLRRKRVGGASSYISQEYEKYREKLVANGDNDKLRELQQGSKLTNVLNELLGLDDASRVKNAMRSGHIRAILEDGDLNVKVLLDFDRFGLIYQCDFTDGGESVVVNIMIAFPNNTFGKIKYGGPDEVEAATQGMNENDKNIVSMFSRVMEPKYNELMNIVAA